MTDNLELRHSTLCGLVRKLERERELILEAQESIYTLFGYGLITEKELDKMRHALKCKNIEVSNQIVAVEDGRDTYEKEIAKLKKKDAKKRKSKKKKGKK